MKKKAVILFNLGGPTSREAIQPFLFNFFMDKNIIGAPLPIRFLLAKYIAFKRSRKEAGDSYEALGGFSPLLENTEKQAKALQKKLGKDYKVFVCMRYWHPMADETAQKVKDYNPDQIILLPLYPQFSTTTSKSSFESWNKAVKKIGLKKPTSVICCYPFEAGFVKASVKLIKEKLPKNLKQTRLLFSAHGLPEKIIKMGDPYQWQCEQTAAKIAEKLNIKNLDWELCYQSRVGPLKWIGPSTEEAIEKAAQDKKGLVIYPLAFVSEHVETLVEIEEEYRHLAKEKGINDFVRVPTVSTHPDFIKGLVEMVKKGENDYSIMAGHDNGQTKLKRQKLKICPQKNCCQNLFKKEDFNG